jgi:predicted MPP superfamily phosphohydrolase
MFLLIVTTIPMLTVLWWVLSDRALVKYAPNARYLRVILAAFAIFQIGFLAYRIFGRMFGWSDEPPRELLVTSYVWHLFVIPTVVTPILAFAALDGIAARIQKYRALAARNFADDSAPEPPPNEEAFVAPKHSRRRFITLAAAAAPPLIGLTGTAVAIPQLKMVRTREIEAPIAGLPAELEGMRIAHLTDMHVGRFTGTKVLDLMIEETAAVSPDLIVITGDIIDYAIKDLPTAVSALQRLRAPHGVYICEGNHDLFESVEGFRDGVTGGGLRLLLNEWESIQIGKHRIDVGGIAWGVPGQRRGMDLRGNMAALTDARRDGASLSMLLAHHPHAFDHAVAAGIPLTFAGHTHGGQLMLTENFGAGSMMFKYWSGLYKNAGNALVVSNGVGNWMPLRINAPAEIILTTLRRA